MKTKHHHKNVELSSFLRITYTNNFIQTQKLGPPCAA